MLEEKEREVRLKRKGRAQLALKARLVGLLNSSPEKFEKLLNQIFRSILGGSIKTPLRSVFHGRSNVIYRTAPNDLRQKIREMSQKLASVGL